VPFAEFVLGGGDIAGLDRPEDRLAAQAGCARVSHRLKSKEVEAMTYRWLYTQNKEAAFYQNGKYLYSAKTNQCEYYEQKGYIYPMNGSDPVFYVRDKWVYTMSSADAYYYA
jgi:hypothetical protein